MANTEQDNSKEIDLTQLSRHMRRYAARVNNSFFNGLLFIKRHIIIIAVLVIAGGVVGYFKDKGTHRYNHKIIVTPNFNSVDYLYEQVDLINSKISEGDTVFLKKIGITNTKELGKIEIEPVVDVYGFIDSKENIFDNTSQDIKFNILKLIAEKGDLKKVVEDPATSKNYKYHLVTFVTSKQTTQQRVAGPLLNYLNSNTYYADVQKEYVKSLDAKIAVNDTTVKQIDRIVSSLTSGKSTGNLLYYNNNTQLDELLKSKTALLKDQEKNRVDRINYTRIIKDNATLLNIKNITATTGRMKFILPILLVLLFAFAIKFRGYYKSQVAKRKDAAVV